MTDISFDVNKGEVVLLSGGNGLCKSIVLKTVYGLLKPWTNEDKIVFEETEITALLISAMIRYGIVYMPQKKLMYEILCAHV